LRLPDKHRTATCRDVRTLSRLLCRVCPRVWPVVAVLCLTGLPGLAGLPAMAQTPPVFGAPETRSGNLQPFPKWTGVVARYRNEQRLFTAPCTPAPGQRCYMREWRAFVESLRGRPLAEQLRLVNSHVNSGRYILDPINWGVEDYWASPYQFLARSGDCEDYAITKFIFLRMLGISQDAMRIVILHDDNLGILHAVLLVLAPDTPERGGRPTWWLLDNQISHVVRADRVRHYRPIYSINETAWWLHR